MRTCRQYLDSYAASHRNPANQIIHMICVPAIFASSVGLAWSVPVYRLIPGTAGNWAHWLNLGTLAGAPLLAFYWRLGLSSSLTGALWLAASYAACAVIESAKFPLLWVSLAVWITAWLAQFYGHKVEGAKPSFTEDILFLLVGPLFVSDKLCRLFRTGLDRAQEQPR
jgi:uncharacterized membrane protein YGL010W